MMSGEGVCIRPKDHAGAHRYQRVVVMDVVSTYPPDLPYEPPIRGKLDLDKMPMTHDLMGTVYAVTDSPEVAMRIERVYGCPPRYSILEREIDRARHSEARRGGGVAPWEHYR